MDTACHDFNAAATGTARLTAVDWLIVWAIIIDDDNEEARRKAWRLENKRRRMRGLPPLPPPAP